MLDQLLQLQSKEGVSLNSSQIAKIPLNEWYSRTSQLQSCGIDPKIYTNRDRLLEAYGRNVIMTTRCCRDAAGRLKTDYASTLLAARYANITSNCPYTERVLLNTTLYALGSADIYSKLQSLQTLAKQNKGLYTPVFKQAGELYQTKENNSLATMSLMAYITKPEKTLGYIISSYDIVKQSYLLDLLGWSEKKVAYAASKQLHIPFLPNIPESWELRLAPHIFNFEYGMIDRTLIQVINQYKDGKLLKYREGLRGRKPITKYPYMERIYPTQKRVLSERIEAFMTQTGALGLQDKYRFYYITPYYAAVAIPPAYRANFRDILNSVHARPLFNITSTALVNGEFL